MNNSPTPKQQFHQIALLDLFGLWLMRLFQILYTFLNFLLYVDLFWIIKNPFYPQCQRNSRYKMATGLVCFLVISELIVTANFHLSLESNDIKDINSVSFIQEVIFFLICISFAIISLVLLIKICKQLSRKGANQKLRNIVLIRYVMLYIVFIPQYIHEGLFIFAYLGYTLNDKNRSLLFHVRIWSKVSAVTTILIPVLRLWDY